MYYIYIIQNKINDKVYVGQSINIKKRWWKHKKELKDNIHPNNHLQNAWNKYGEDNFEFYILDTLETEEELNKYEEVYRKWYDDINLCYNKIPGGGKPPIMYGKDNPRYGKPFSEKHIENLRKSRKENPVSEEARKKMSLASRERKYSKETIAKRIESRKWYKHSEETRRKISEAHKGRIGTPCTEKTKEKLRQANTGRKFSEEARKKLSDAKKGHIVTEETREKLRKANKGKESPNKGKKISERTRKVCEKTMFSTENPPANKGINNQIGFGEEKSIPEWALDPRCKVCRSTIYNRIKRGWNIEDAITIKK